jgi:hypothetical protein
MTISTTIIKNSYSGNNSTTVFAYTFEIAANTEIQVIIRASTGTETVKSLTTDYTVSGVGSATGGNVTMVSPPATGETLVIRRVTPKTQTVDLVENDPFTAETVEGAFDKAIAVTQEVQEEVDRSIKLSRTNTMASTEFTVDAASRASKILGFDTNGELSVTQELGSYKGNWSASTVYGARDIVKDTSTNNIFIANTGHTSSGSQPLTTNTDSAKWDLLVDAASATSSASAAATSATNAANSATAAATSETNAGNSATSASTSASNASTSETNASNSATAASNAQAAAEAALDTFDDKFLGSKASDPTVDNDGNSLTDGALYFNTTSDVMKVYDLGNTQWKQLTPTTSQQTNIDTVAANDSNITSVAGQISPTNNIATVAGDSTDIQTLAGITNLNNLANSYSSVVTAATNLTSINSFANTYLGPSASAPTQDPDGSALDLGDLYFDTTQNELKVYKSSGWAAAGSTVNGTSDRFTYTVSSSTTTITGADNSGSVLAYDAGFIDVYLNGVKMVNGSDVTVTSGTSVVFATAIGASGTDTVDIIAFGTFQLANISINDLTDTPAALGSAGQALVVNSGGTALEYANASSAEVYGFNKTFTASTINKVVTVVGGKFVIDGVSQDTLELLEGNTYKFDQSDASNSGHPFLFSTNSNNSPSAPYTTGVTVSGTAGSANAYVQIVVASSAPTLYYYCGNHSNMGGQANTPVPAPNTLQIVTTNQGADNITQSEYESFDDVQYAASGFTWSISNGKLTATI